ncbi:MAG TPA: LppX_LprAFG lipoprotein, partial [Ktedonobacteraceae bacterium]|nr:LppX_LprAFG lipoprotein [Ktedonobacteraceae bacterium]
VQFCKKYISLVGMLALLFVLAACSVPGLAGASPSPAQTLQNSAQAMSKLSATHIDLQAGLSLQSSTSNGGMTFNLAGQGDATKAGDASVQLSLGQSPLLGVISKGQTVYVQLRKGTWYSVSKSQITDSTQNFFSQSLVTRLEQIMAIVQNAKLTDHGQESLNGTQLDHITAVLDQQTLQQLNTQLSAMMPAKAQNGQSQITQASLDLWIDQSTSYVHQVILNLTAQVDAQAVQHLTGQSTGSTSGTLPATLKAQLNFSKFNQPINIQAPANSTPLIP